MKRSILLICFIITSFSLVWAQYPSDGLYYKANMAYWSRDDSAAYSLYSKLDSIEPIDGFYDLWKFYFASEMMEDSLKSKELLFRLVEKGLDKGGVEQYFLHDIGLHKRPYWIELDSIISIAESKRCQPFIDSLAAMREIDQAIRQKPWTDENRRKMMVIDSINTAKLELLIAQYGFPTWELVGRDGAENAWLIAQHSATLLPWYLKHYRQAVQENNADIHYLVLMEDRFLMHQGRPQIYGTQLSFSDSAVGFYPIADVKHVNERRFAVGWCPIEKIAKSHAGADSVVIFAGDLDYSNNYYPNISDMYAVINSFQQNDENIVRDFAIERTTMYCFPRDLEVYSRYLFEVEKDTARAVIQTKKIVLCGRRIDEEWNLPQLLMDSVRAYYTELRADYERMITKDDDMMLNAITSFDTLVKVLESGSYPRYTIDAWNGNIRKLISAKSKTLTKNDCKAFFEWLFKQVTVGNYHLFDYAELYDEVYYRLYGKSYYGQKLFEKKVRIYKPKNVDERRARVMLPSLEVCERTMEIL